MSELTSYRNDQAPLIRRQQADVSTFKTLLSWVDSPETLMQFAGPFYTYPLTLEQLMTSMDDPGHMAFGFVDGQSGDMVAYAELYVSADDVKLRRILVGADHRGKGIGMQIVQQLLEVAFTEQHKDRAQLNVFDWNTGAIRCYEKVGFVVNPGQQWERAVNGKSWLAINMVLDKKDWNQKES